MNAEDKVLSIYLRITNENKDGINEIIDWVQCHLPNLCEIVIFDYSDNLDKNIHNKWMKLIDRPHLFWI